VLRDPAQAAVAARKLLAAMEVPFEIAGRELRLSASIGISICPHDAIDAADMRRRSEAAMYCVKQQGRNGFQFYVPEMITAAEEQIILAGDLRHAIERDQLELHYQPQVTNTGELVGFEALLRWHHPQRGEVSPTVFIPIAEASGLILPIGRWVLIEACRQGAAWQVPGKPRVKVAVNVSVAQFLQGDFYDLVIGTMRRFDVVPGCLELEITESVLMMDNGAASEKLSALRSAGVRIAIDDFGTGYSSLAYLQRLPVDSLKIDRSFVSAIAADATDASRRSAVVRAVTAMALDLGISVTAEGVETTAQHQYLTQLGCHRLQGFLFGKPQPADVAQSLLEQWRTGRAS
jgi:EAL domain-containing protein (putative c-di-GMP-specific phosphodiesterase class I)